MNDDYGPWETEAPCDETRWKYEVFDLYCIHYTNYCYHYFISARRASGTGTLPSGSWWWRRSGRWGMSKRTDDIRQRLAASSVGVFYVEERPTGFAKINGTREFRIMREKIKRISESVATISTEWGDPLLTEEERMRAQRHRENAEMLAHAPADIRYLLERVSKLESATSRNRKDAYRACETCAEGEAHDYFKAIVARCSEALSE